MELPLQDRTLGPLHNPTTIDEERREHRRLQARERRKTITQEEREQERVRARQRRMAMSNEQKEQERLRARRRRMGMTDEQREKERIRLRQRRMAMTDEQREQERLRRRKYLDNKTEHQIFHERERNCLYQRQWRQLRSDHVDSSEQTALPLNGNANEEQPLENIQEHAQVSTVLHKHAQREAERSSEMEENQEMMIDEGSKIARNLDIDLNNDLYVHSEGESSEEMNAS